MTAQSSPFMFDTEFAGQDTAAPHAPEASEPEPAILYTDEDLDAARRAAHESAFAAGQASAHESISQQLALAVESVGESLRHMAETHDKRYGAAIDDVVVIALGVARKFIGEQLPESARDIVVQSARSCMERLHGHRQVTVTVAEPLAEPVREQLAELQNLSGLTVEVRASAALSGTDCEISWDGGFAVRSDDGLWEELSALAGRAVERDSPAHAAPPEPTPPTGPVSDPVPELPVVAAQVEPEATKPEPLPTFEDPVTDTQQPSDSLSDALGPELRAALEQARQATSD